MLYFDLINPYITYMIIVLLFVGAVRAVFTKQEFITKHKRTLMNIAIVLLIWTQIAR